MDIKDLEQSLDKFKELTNKGADPKILNPLLLSINGEMLEFNLHYARLNARRARINVFWTLFNVALSLYWLGTIFYKYLF